MRVLVVTNMYPSEREPWFGCFVQEQVEALRALGVELDVLSFDGRADRLTYVRAAREVRRRVRRQRFDLVHAHYGLAGLVGLAQSDVPVVTTFWGSDAGYVRWQRHVGFVVARRTVPIFVARANARELGLDSAAVISSGVDTTRFRPIDRLGARRALGWPLERRLVLFPGARRNRRKRADLFDAAVREARRHDDAIEGVSLEGFSRDETPLVVNAAEALLMTSDWEGSPLAVKEALACGTPVVSVPVGDVPEVVEELPGCVVAPREPRALARGLLEALRVGRTDELRARSLEYSQERTARRILAVYERVADGRNGKRRGARRLCMVVHGPYPVGEPRVAREVRGALTEGYDVDVVALRRPGEAAAEVVDGARVLRIPLSHRRGVGIGQLALEYTAFTAGATLLVAALSLRRRYGVVQVHNPPDFLALAAVVPKLLGAGVILDVHDLAPDMFAMRFAGRPGSRLFDGALHAVERSAAQFADEVLTVHEPYRRELIARGVSPAKTTVVMNALDEALLPPSVQPNGAGPYRIFYHGTITPSYGVGLVVEAAALVAAELPNLRVELYGEGDALPDIRARAAELGVDDLVQANGRYLPQREVLARARTASVGVIPNLPTRLNRFALSSKLFEYVALGIPVVSADLPTIREHFSSSEVSFFRAGDPKSLAQALLATARDPDGAAARAIAARARYADYAWSAQLPRYLDVLSRAAGMKAAR